MIEEDSSPQLRNVHIVIPHKSNDSLCKSSLSLHSEHLLERRQCLLNPYQRPMGGSIYCSRGSGSFCGQGKQYELVQNINKQVLPKEIGPVSHATKST